MGSFAYVGVDQAILDLPSTFPFKVRRPAATPVAPLAAAACRALGQAFQPAWLSNGCLLPSSDVRHRAPNSCHPTPHLHLPPQPPPPPPTFLTGPQGLAGGPGLAVV